MKSDEMTEAIQAKWKVHPDAQAMEEEWSGITDPNLRRKLQNRLNQRAARRRKAAQGKSGNGNFPTSNELVRRASSQLENDNELLALLIAKAQSSRKWLQYSEDGKPLTAFESLRTKDPCRPPLAVLLENKAVDIRSFCTQMIDQKDSRLLYPLPADHLLTLVYYNVYRALIQNVAILGLDLDLMATDDYPSPFLPLSPSSSSAIRNLPPALQPTELQQYVAHHPEYDIIPYPALRDNILRRSPEEINDVELCIDMIGDGRGCQDSEYETQKEAGVIVWGEPWDPDVWEVTEKFISKWSWMLKGVVDLERSTNKFRRQRGQEQVFFASDEVHTV